MLAQKLADRKSTSDILTLVNEAIEMLQLVKQWSSAGTATPQPSEVGDDMSDDEAMRLLAEMESGAPPPPTTPPPDTTAVKQETSATISDDEAMRLLAEMEGTVTPQTTSTIPTSLSADEEAAMLLA
jgi:hypothetical protein